VQEESSRNRFYGFQRPCFPKIAKCARAARKRRKNKRSRQFDDLVPPFDGASRRLGITTAMTQKRAAVSGGF